MEEVLDWQLKQMGTSLKKMKRIGVKNFHVKLMTCIFAPGERDCFQYNSR